MFTMDGRISTFSFHVSSWSSSLQSNGSGSIEGLLQTTFNVSDISSLGELGVVSLLSFDQLEREDTANYTCTATNMLPQTTTLTALSPFIPLVVLGKLVEHYLLLYNSVKVCIGSFHFKSAQKNPYPHQFERNLDFIQ